MATEVPLDLRNKIIQGDALEVCKSLQDNTIDCIITSPPYWSVRDYGVNGQWGQEPHFQEWITRMLSLTLEWKRILKKSGALFLNVGDIRNRFPRKGEKILHGKNSVLKHTRLDDKQIASQGVPDIPTKALCLIPQRLAIRMEDEQKWCVRNDIIWHKPNPMPSSAQDRWTDSHEYIWFCTKEPKKYYFNMKNILVPAKDQKIQKYNNKRQNDNFKKQDNVPSRNAPMYKGFNKRYKEKMQKLQTEKYGKDDPNNLARKQSFYNETSKAFKAIMAHPRDVWKIPVRRYKGAHYATFPEQLIEPMIKACCPEGGLVLDPFCGSGTVAVVAERLQRYWLGIELNPEYIQQAYDRIYKGRKVLESFGVTL